MAQDEMIVLRLFGHQDRLAGRRRPSLRPRRWGRGRFPVWGLCRNRSPSTRAGRLNAACETLRAIWRANCARLLGVSRPRRARQGSVTGQVCETTTRWPVKPRSMGDAVGGKPVGGMGGDLAGGPKGVLIWVPRHQGCTSYGPSTRPIRLRLRMATNPAELISGLRLLRRCRTAPRAGLRARRHRPAHNVAGAMHEKRKWLEATSAPLSVSLLLAVAAGGLDHRLDGFPADFSPPSRVRAPAAWRPRVSGSRPCGIEGAASRQQGCPSLMSASRGCRPSGMWALGLGDGKVPKWKIEAASTALAWPSVHTLDQMVERADAAPRRYPGTDNRIGDGAGQRDVEALFRPVPVHRGQQDFPPRPWPRPVRANATASIPGLASRHG